MNRAAGAGLLLVVFMKLNDGNKDLLHGDFEERTQGVEVVHRRKAFSLLPLINRPRFFKAKISLKVTNRQAAFHAQTADIASRRCQVDHRKIRRVHQIASFFGFCGKRPDAGMLPDVRSSIQR